MAKLIDQNYLSVHGHAKATRYLISPTYRLIQPIDIIEYYEKEIDETVIIDSFNFEIIHDVLPKHSVFSEIELQNINKLQNKFNKNIAQLSDVEYRKEFEHLAIDLSWKSYQIERNTYSLLETERLLKEKETASEKTKKEASMLLNHKEALDFLMENPKYINPISVSKIEDIHSILVKELAVERNLRKRRVGISGKNYKPMDNEFQIHEALQSTCDIINNKKSVFEKA